VASAATAAASGIPAADAARADGFLEASFLAGRQFASVADFDAQLSEWVGRVNSRPRRASDGAALADRIGADRAAMAGIALARSPCR
jgi:hypothetical protein